MARESLLPLSIGLVLAVAVHLLAGPLVQQHLVRQDSDYRLQARQTDQEDQPDQPPEQRLRRITPGLAERRSSEVNLVSYDHYQQLMARKGRVDQPAVQRDTAPDPTAQQTPVQPSPPQPTQPDRDQPATEQTSPPQRPQPAPPAAATPPAADTAPQRDEPREDQPGASPDPPARALPDLPVADVAESDQADLLDLPTQTDANKAGRLAAELPHPQADSELKEPQLTSPNTPQPRPRSSPPAPPQARPAEPPTDRPGAPPGADDDPQPTAAVQDEFESPPVRRIPAARVRPGGVLSVQGVRIRTVRPRISPVAAMTAVPRNPVFTVHFNHDGKVTHAIKRRSTGYDHVDGPIVASLYKWTARGELPEDGLTISALQIILRDRPDDEADSQDAEAGPNDG